MKLRRSHLNNNLSFYLENVLEYFAWMNNQILKVVLLMKNGFVPITYLHRTPLFGALKTFALYLNIFHFQVVHILNQINVTALLYRLLIFIATLNYCFVLHFLHSYEAS